MKTSKESLISGGQTAPSLDLAKRRPYAPPELKVYGTVSELTHGTASVGQDGTNTRQNRQSDRIVKQNIQRVGTHPLGIGLYLFDYKPEFQRFAGSGRQFGVMADEVETVLPNAVAVGWDGFKRVDYTMLGIDVPGSGTR
jgi:hypothetical protein